MIYDSFKPKLTLSPRAGFFQCLILPRIIFDGIEGSMARKTLAHAEGPTPPPPIVAGQEICPGTPALQKNGRGEWNRTTDLYVPNVALYQAELHPDTRPKSTAAELGDPRSQAAS